MKILSIVCDISISWCHKNTDGTWSGTVLSARAIGTRAHRFDNVLPHEMGELVPHRIGMCQIALRAFEGQVFSRHRVDLVQVAGDRVCVAWLRAIHFCGLQRCFMVQIVYDRCDLMILCTANQSRSQVGFYLIPDSGTALG